MITDPLEKLCRESSKQSKLLVEGRMVKRKTKNQVRAEGIFKAASDLEYRQLKLNLKKRILYVPNFIF